MPKLIAVLAVVLGLLSSSAGAIELVSYDAGCKVGEDVKPLRQTIIILDEAAISSGSDADGKNLSWKRPLLEVADAIDALPQGNLAPHEKLRIYLARKDGSELTPMFSGCSPNISDSQRRRLEERSTFIDWALTGGVAKTIATRRSDYKNALADAIASAVRAATSKEDHRDSGALIRPLATMPHLIDLSGGIPRVVVISPFDLVENEGWSNIRAARSAGFDLGARAGVDFERAEVHVVALRRRQDRFLRPFADAFFLRSRGLLVGWRVDGIPQLLAPPTDVRIFGGTVQIGEIPAPVQVRISFDNQGTLVNSWIEVRTGRSLATPISGKAICRSKDVCEIKGDGNLMGQAWNPDLKDDPVFDPQFAWSGLRYFEMSYNGADGSVRIWDPKVGRIQMGDRQLEDFRFAVHRTEGQQF